MSSDENILKEAYDILNNETLREKFDKRLIELNLNSHQAEKMLGMERKTLNGILNRTAKRVDVANVIKLGIFLGERVEEFIKIFIREMSPEDTGEINQTQKNVYLVQNFDLANLYKAKFLSNKSDFGKIEDRIKTFFGFSELNEYDALLTGTAFSKTKKSTANFMREFWVRSANALFQKLDNPYAYDRTMLSDLLPKIRPYTRNVEKGLITVSRALYHAGVTVIFQPHLPTSQVRGGTFLINGKPCIVLTDLNKSYSTLWFALMHELCHVLFDLEHIEKTAYHLTGEPDLFLIDEEGADKFARDYFLSQEKINYIYPLIDNELLVSQFAEKSNIHPCFIYEFYMYDMNKQGKNVWWKYKGKNPDTKTALGQLNTQPWERETLDESVTILKEKIFNI